MACQQCGEVISAPADALTFTCPFCGSNKVLYREPLEDVLRPRHLILFKVEPQSCLQITFQADHTQGTLVRLPDNPPDEAWSEAAASLQKAAAHDCQQACDAGHLRQFRWNAQFSQLNWTLLLLPLYSTYYLDDEGRRKPILIHAQTGQVTGTRRVSLKRTRGYSLGIFLFSMAIILIGLLSDLLLTSRYATFALVSTLVIIFGIAGILGSALFYLIAWDFNRKQALKE